jgi:hypothetical protein
MDNLPAWACGSSRPRSGLVRGSLLLLFGSIARPLHRLPWRARNLGRGVRRRTVTRGRCGSPKGAAAGRLADHLGARSPTPWHLCGLLSIGGVPGRKARFDSCLVALRSDQKWMIKRAPPHGSVCRIETPPRSKGMPL